MSPDDRSCAATRGPAPTTCRTRAPIPPTSTGCPATRWGTARLPVGVRLEFVGDAEALELDYQTQTDDLGYRGEGAGTDLHARDAATRRSTVPAHLGSGRRGSRSPARRRRPRPAARGVPPRGHAADACSPSRAKAASSRPRRAASLARVRRLDRRRLDRERAVGRVAGRRGATTRPRRREPRLRGLGAGRDAVGRADRRARRRRHLDLARHELLDPHPVLDRAVRGADPCVHRVVREGHPDTPIVVTSPILRPDAETTANALGATLADLRVAMEDVTRERSPPATRASRSWRAAT